MKAAFTPFYLLLIFALLYPGFAVAADGRAPRWLERCGQLFGTITNRVPYLSGARQKISPPKEFESRVTEVGRGAYKPSAVSYDYTTLDKDLDLGADQTSRISMQYQGKEVAQATLYLKGETLRFDIRVEKEFRGTKLYAHMLGLALAKYPSTQAIPSRNAVSKSENARVFVKAAFDSDAAWKKLRVPDIGEKDALELRKKMLAAIDEMPSVKARSRNGFGRITKLIFCPERGEVAFYAERGNREGQPGPRILIEQENQAFEILPTGAVSRQPKESLTLGDYPELPLDVWFQAESTD